MELMTPEDRKKFVAKRVDQILSAFDEFSRIISSMTTSQRHAYVHRRVELDLLTFESVNSQVEKHVTAREVEFKWVALLDVAILAALLLVLYEDPQHRAHLALVLLGFAVSRLENYRLLIKARNILDLLYRLYSRLANTASLEFLVDEMSQSEEADQDERRRSGP